MTDKIFFPLILFVAIGMVLVAIGPKQSTCPTGSLSAADTNYINLQYTGAQLNRFITNGKVQKNPCKLGTGFRLHLHTLNTPPVEAAMAGPHFRLASDIEHAFSNRTIRITVRARALTENGAAGFQANYASGAKNASGWQTFALSPEFADYMFEHEVPDAGADRGVDYLGLRPADTRVGVGMEIESLTFLNSPSQRAEEQVPKRQEAGPQ